MNPVIEASPIGAERTDRETVYSHDTLQPVYTVLARRGWHNPQARPGQARPGQARAAASSMPARKFAWRIPRRAHC